jgi:hypothetical protein
MTNLNRMYLDEIKSIMKQLKNSKSQRIAGQ